MSDTVSNLPLPWIHGRSLDPSSGNLDPNVSWSLSFLPGRMQMLALPSLGSRRISYHSRKTPGAEPRPKQVLDRCKVREAGVTGALIAVVLVIIAVAAAWIRMFSIVSAVKQLQEPRSCNQVSQSLKYLWVSGRACSSVKGLDLYAFSDLRVLIHRTEEVEGQLYTGS